MTEADSDGNPKKLDGLSIERAVDMVDETKADPGEVRETLAIVAKEDSIRRAAVDDALANASMVVTTAETRVELAGDKLDSAQAAAIPVSDLQFVSDRVHNFEARMSNIEERADDLGDAIQHVIEMKETGNLYRIARRIKAVTNAASEVQQAADNLQGELDAFEAWLTHPERRIEELAVDLDSLANSVSELTDVVENLDASGREAGDDAHSDPGSEPARRWAAAMIRHRVLSLLIRDLNAELTAVHTWAEREGLTSPSGIEPRLAEVQERHAALEERLTARAAPEWTEQFNQQLSALNEALEAMEPPVVWADVDAVVAEHRPTVE